MEGAVSLYFGEGFNLCKKQIGVLHPNLDIQDLQINPDLVDEDEEDEKYVQETKTPSLGISVHISFCCCCKGNINKIVSLHISYFLWQHVCYA